MSDVATTAAKELPAPFMERRRGLLPTVSTNKTGFFDGRRSSKERFLVLNLVKSNLHSKGWEYICSGTQAETSPHPFQFSMSKPLKNKEEKAEKCELFKAMVITGILVAIKSHTGVKILACSWIINL